MHRLRLALNCSTALVAVALVGTLLVAAPPASAGGGNGGKSGIHSHGVQGSGGAGGTNTTTNSNGGNGSGGVYGGGGGGGGAGAAAIGGGAGGAGGYDCDGCTGGGGAGGYGANELGGSGYAGGDGSDGAGGGGGGGGANAFWGKRLPKRNATGGYGGKGGTGSSHVGHVGGGGGGGGAGGYGAVVTGSGSLGTVSVDITGGNGGNGGSGGANFLGGAGYGGGGGTGGNGLLLTNSQVTVGPGASIAGGNGGTGGSTSGDFITIGANGGNGGNGLLLTNSQVTVGAGASIAGGKGGTGGYGTYNGTGGAAGGVGVYSAVGAAISNSGSINGGTGGSGGKGGESSPGHDAAGGPGGTGGAGVSFYGNSSSSLTNANNGTINGGAGGTGGYGGEAGKDSKGGGPGGTGGTGGAGVNLGNGITIIAINSGTITGGTGGSGGTGRSTTLGFTPGNGGHGGTGGAGVTLGNGTALTNAGTINGGTGGQGGAGGSDTGPVGIGGNGGNGGNGGTGVYVNGGTLINSGTINGGTRGGGGAYGKGSDSSSNGSPGAGGSYGTNVVVTNGTVINSGTIVAGYGANAITFNSGTNLLELRAGSNIQGTVDATRGTNTLALGGTVNASFDVSNIGPAAQYQGFSTYIKTGTSTWTLTGTTTATTAWNITQGTLAISADNNLGAAAGGLTFNGGTLQTTAAFSTARSITLAGGGTFNTTANLTATGVISGSGTLTKTGAATLTLTGTNTYTGGTTVDAGGLMVNGAIVGTVDVASGGSLGGSGTIGGVTTVASGGTLIGRQGQVLNFSSDLALSSGSNVNISLGTPSSTGLFNVAGNLTLGGTLNITDLGGFSVGTYRLFDYGGSLTNNGLAIGTLPFGIDPGDVSIQTAVAHQVNLINATGVTLRFWDGGNPALHDNGVVNGGNGAWALSNTNQNWTDVNGAVNGAWSNGQFAIFEGQAGTVTVDDSSGAISVTGMQFATDGYRVEGGAITLERAATIIRTGFGGAGSASVTATIASQLIGTGGLVKTDFGTLVLTGANSYSGGTVVLEGTLQLGDGGTSGSIVGNVINHGALAFNRSDTYTFGGVISGTGTVIQAGTGTTVLTGANTYSGGTTINAGTLSVAADGNLGAAAGGLIFNGGTLQTTAAFTMARNILLSSGGGKLQTDADLTASGVIFGGGALTKTGNGQLTLTGDNIYTGGTTISAGTLRIGNGGTSGSIIGDVRNNGVLVFDRSDDLAYRGTISGTGALAKLGAGTLVLTGNNTYAGGTTISAGTLVIGQGGTSGSIVGNVANNGVLAFDRFDDLSFAGTISGTGALIKAGAGTLTLTAANTYSGGTAIDAGTLAVASDGNLGAASGGLSFNGGTLKNTSAFTTARAITLAAGGGTFNTTADLTATADITGQGALTKTGAGVLTLTGNNVYSGGTIINAGTLSVATNGNLGAAAGGLTFNGGTLQTTAAFTMARNILLNSGGGTLQTDADLAASGVIFGAGALTKTGNGRLTLTGDNVYTGGTTISAGTLQIGDGGTSGSIIGDVRNNGVLVFDRSNDLAYLGTISGTGALAKLGAGALLLTGTESYTGSTTVDGGALIVNGSIASSSLLTVNAGALVGGNGILPTTTINGGTLSPGNSIGTITVQGNLVLSSAATYLVQVSRVAADRTNVSGTAALGGTVHVLATPDDYGPHTTYTILHADGGVSGTETLSISVSSVFLDPTLSFDANNVFLNLTQLPFSSAARTPNQRAVAGALQVSGIHSVLGAAVFNQATGAAARQAFDALSGEVHASVAGVLLNDSRYLRSAVLGRLRQAPYVGDAGRLAALGSGGPELAYQPSPQPAYAAGFPVKAPRAAPPRSDLTFWAQGYGAWGTFEGDGNAATINRSLGGALVGVDSRLGNGWRVGGAAGYSQSNVRIDARGSRATVDSGHVALYGGGSFGAWNLRGGAAYSYHAIDTSRSIVFPGFFEQATSSYHGDTAQVFGEVGYGFGLGGVAVEPFAGLAWVHVKTNGFGETGGVAALTGAGTTEDVGYATLGQRFATTFALVNGMALTPRVSFAWQHAFTDLTPAAALTFQSTGVGFGITGVPLARDSALVEAGLDLRITPQATLGVSYLGQLAGSVQDHAVKGQLTWRF